jgi:hypothetical protein
MDNANQVQSTTNYGLFQFMDSNRDTNRGHIEALKAAFEESGNFTQVQPILVNENFQIIDGQHRFVACQELGVPIYYTQVAGLGVEDARKMNVLHRKWFGIDYAKSYAEAGDTNYQRFLQLMEDYGFSITTTITYCLGSDPQGVFKSFRNGGFVLEDENGARERLEKLQQVQEFVTFGTNEAFTRALLKVIQLENYDHRRMLRKLAANPQLIRQMGTVQEMLRMLEDVYNYNMSEANRLRFF